MVDLRSFDFNLVRVLVMLEEERSVTSAATRLGITQPAVSAALARMREAFDDPLFIRTQRGMTPSIRGAELARAAKLVLHDFEELFATKSFDPATAEASLTVGANDYGQFSIVAPLLKTIRNSAPGIRINVRPLEDDICGQLERQEIDVAITLLSKSPQNAIATRLFSEDFVGAVDKANNSVGSRVSLDEFCGFEHVRVSVANTRLTDPVDEELKIKGRRRDIVLTIPNFFMIPSLLRGSDLFSVVPLRLTRYFDWTLKPVALPLHLPGFTMNLIWHQRTVDSPRHVWLREQLQSISRSIEKGAADKNR